MLADIADRFRDATAKEMEDWTHREGMPWHRVFEVEGRQGHEIPFEYQLDDLEQDVRDIILETAKDRDSIISHYQ